MAVKESASGETGRHGVSIRLRDAGPMVRDKAFRALFFAALIAGVAAGAVASVIQAGKMWPLIGTVSRIKAAIAA